MFYTFLVYFIFCFDLKKIVFRFREKTYVLFAFNQTFLPISFGLLKAVWKVFARLVFVYVCIHASVSVNDKDQYTSALQMNVFTYRSG